MSASRGAERCTPSPGAWQRGRCDPVEAELRLSKLRRRTLFATASWKHPEEGLVLTAFVDGPDTQLPSTPWNRLHLLMDRKPPQVVARETACFTCGATVQRGDVACADCGGVGWTGFRGNLALGPPVHLGQAQLHVSREALDEAGARILATIGL